MGRGLGNKDRSSLTIANIESSFYEQSLTIPSAQQVGFETTKLEDPWQNISESWLAALKGRPSVIEQSVPRHPERWGNMPIQK
jgi:hypothetical protein